MHGPNFFDPQAHSTMLYEEKALMGMRTTGKLWGKIQGWKSDNKSIQP
jgi:hypothetical protein